MDCITIIVIFYTILHFIMPNVSYISSKENKVSRMVLKMAETQVTAKLSDNTSKF